MPPEEWCKMNMEGFGTKYQELPNLTVCDTLKMVLEINRNDKLAMMKIMRLLSSKGWKVSNLVSIEEQFLQAAFVFWVGKRQKKSCLQSSLGVKELVFIYHTKEL
ncbi:hypothetical protein MUK42_08011 [Musa troglodytarum]|uniref:Uncharacterized protein n=1 Tax=Musa troglodytarum TaxID=320322 RepID=A0A9E7FIL9_9LILI|nr:hypothetical protein MUK42_08011 [Musa troglodytarum]